MRALQGQQPESESQRRVDVVVAESPGGAKEVLVRDMSYGAGVGWYVQRTIRLDREQVDALMRALCCARQSCGRAGAADAAAAEGAPRAGADKIVQLTRLGPRS